jgi:hypothetical protein
MRVVRAASRLGIHIRGCVIACEVTLQTICAFVQAAGDEILHPGLSATREAHLFLCGEHRNLVSYRGDVAESSLKNACGCLRTLEDLENKGPEGDSRRWQKVRRSCCL